MSTQPLFDMSKATPIKDDSAKPLFDMSKAKPVNSSGGGKPLFDMSKATPLEQTTEQKKQPSVGQVLTQPTKKTDEEYMGYTGPAGVVGATIHGLNRVAEETKNAAQGAWEMGKDIFQNPDRPLIIPDKTGKYAGQETIAQKYNPIKGLSQIGGVPQAIRDINASPDPATYYAQAAEDTAAQGAGQALTAIALDKAGERLIKPKAPVDSTTMPRGWKTTPVKSATPLEPVVAKPAAPTPYADTTGLEPELIPTKPAATPAAVTAAEPLIPPKPFSLDKPLENPVGLRREGAKLSEAAEAHQPAVREQIYNLPNAKLQSLARAHGIDPSAPEYSFGKEMRVEGHQTGRQTLADKIASTIGNDEMQNIGRSAENLEHNPDMANKAKADRAQTLFPRLRGPVDEAGNPSIGGGS